MSTTTTTTMNLDDVRNLAAKFGVKLEEDDKGGAIRFEGKSDLGVVEMHGFYFSAEYTGTGDNLDLVVRVHAIEEDLRRSYDTRHAFIFIGKDRRAVVRLFIPSDYRSADELLETERLLHQARLIADEINRTIEKNSGLA